MILIAVALIAVAFVVRLTQPSDAQQLEPFVTTVEVGQSAEGRDITLTVNDAYLADRLTTSTWTGETEGVWLVVDATIGSKLESESPYATLRADGVEWRSSDRAGDSSLGGLVDAGLPQTGSFVFELPKSLIDTDAGRHVTVRFANSLVVQLDSAFDLPLDLSTLDHRDSVAIQGPGVTP